MPIPRRLAAAVTVAALGGLGGVALATRPDAKPAAHTTAAPVAPPAEVRTVVVTRVVHRTRHVHPRARRPLPAAAPPPTPAASPAPAVAAAPAPQPAVVRVRRTRPLPVVHSRTSGASGGHEREHETEHEGGGDD